MFSELSSFLSLCFILLVIAFFWAIFRKRSNKEDTVCAKNGQYRIILLANGKYAVEEYIINAWTTPRYLGRNVFDKYPEAVDRMCHMTAENKRREGYRVVKEVSRSKI